MFRKFALAAVAATLAVAVRPIAAHAQKALVYCPVNIDASGCGRIADALASRFPDGVDRGYDGSSGTVDLHKADLQHYSVIVVPSLADNDATKPYALLRELAPKFRMAINGRVAVYSGAPDQGAANRDAKNALIGNLASWAAGGHKYKTGLVGLVALLDLSSDATARYNWVKALSPAEVSADAEMQSFGAVESMGDAGSLLSKGGSAIAYGNMASLGLHIGKQGAAHTVVGAMAGGTSRQAVLVKYSINGDDALGSSTAGGASFSKSVAGGASMSTSGTTASATTTTAPTLTTDKPDYSPGDTVAFTGTGFGAADTVVITLHEDPNWTDPDRTVTAVADANGNFTNHTFVVDAHDFGVTFTATAVGSPSGLSAQTTFTDGNKVNFSTTATGAAVSTFGTLTPNQCQAAFAQEYQGSNLDVGNHASRVVNLSSNPTGAQFFATANCTGPGISSVTIPTNVSNIGFSFKIATAGSYTLTGDAPDLSATNDATATVTIAAANSAPVAVNDSYSTNEDVQLVVPVAGVLTNDTDADANTLTAVRNGSTTGPSNGTLTLNANGSFTYTPNANFNGTDSFTYFAFDGTTNSATAATVTITVNAVNDAPSFTKGADQTVLEDAAAQSVTGWATAIASGPANESGQVVNFIVTNDNNALFSVQPAIDPTGKLTYTLAANANGASVVTVSLHDDGGTANSGVDTSAPQTFNITVTAVNDAPSFTKGADQTVNEDAGAQTVSGWATLISAGPTNEAGQTLSFVVTNNTNTALFSAGPAVSATGELTYTPAANASGTATITLKVTDNGGTANGGVDASATQTFVINVTSVNDAPSFTKGADQTVNEDAAAQSVTTWATAISAGPNETQTLTFAATNDNNALFSAQPAIDATGKLTYTPAANAFGVATVTVTLKDDGGTANGGVDTSAPQTFTITINAVNDAPSFTKGANQTVSEDAGLQTVANWATAISAGPANESSQTLTFAVTGNTNAALFAVAPAVAANGTLTYTPAANANGSATITLKVTDNGGTTNGGVDASAEQTFSITVTAVNDAPSFTKGADQTVNEDAGAQTVAGWATAISFGAPDETEQVLAFNVTNNTNTALFSVLPAINPTTGALTYTPAANAYGTATITITLKDDGGTANGGVDTSAPQSFTITVNPVNDAPSFTKGADQTVNEDAGAQTVNGWATGISAGPNEATQTVDFVVSASNTALFSTQPAVDASGKLTYTPAPNANGSATITIHIHDNGGTANSGVDASSNQTFTITVNAVNDAPSFTKGADQTVLEDAGAKTVTGWATAISAGPADESGQTVSFAVTNNTNSALFSAQPAVDASGTLTYTPAADANGSATITVHIHDNGGTLNGGVENSADQTFIITVKPVNDAPSFTKGADQTKLEDAGAQTVAGWATALSKGPANESGQTLTFTVTNDNNALFSVQPAIDASGQLTYTPAPNANGTANLTVTLKDDGGVADGGVDTSAPQTFKIDITPVNDAPTFDLIASHTVLEDAVAQSVTGALTNPLAGPANESAQTLTLTVTNNNNGLFSSQPSIDGSGTLTYTPAANANGTATVTVKLKDNGGTANLGVDETTKTLTITVTAVNDVPSFTKGADQTSLEDAGVQTVNGWASAVSAGPNESSQVVDFQVSNDNNALFATQPAIDATGKLTYTAAPNANGSATVTVALHDNGGTANGGVDLSATQTFTITISAVNDAPSFTKGANQTVLEDAAAQSVVGWAGGISAGPTDEASQTLDFVVSNSNTALFSVQPAVAANGTLTYTPAANAYGVATVTVHIHDNGGTANGGVDASADQTFTITITGVNDAPSFTKGANQSVNEDAPPQSVTGWATAISAGPNEGTQTVDFVVTNDNNALFSSQPAVDASGKLTYALTPNAFGSATVTIHAHDDGGTTNGGVNVSADQTFTITVNSVNDAPTFGLVGSQTVLEDAGAQSVVNALTNPLPGPSNESSQILTLTVTNDKNALFSTQPAIDAAGTLTYTPAPNANGTATVTVQLKDNGGTANGGIDLTTKTFTITVTPVNDAPVITAFSSPLQPYAVNTQIPASGTFTDVDLGDSPPDVLSGTIDWGDGSSPASVSITGTGTSRNFSGSHSYAAAGVYTIVATIKDAANATAQTTYQYVVAYDPSAGFVTGGGWINSPSNACLLTTACIGATGKANFGFVSKYQKGSSVPTGNTEFQFQAGNLNFKSINYEWLVISGARAQYKGTGTINGSGNYGFLLTAVDGSINGGGGTDAFRIKIWDINNGGVIVYDNQIGTTDDAGLITSGTLLGGGSISIKAK